MNDGVFTGRSLQFLNHNVLVPRFGGRTSMNLQSDDASSRNVTLTPTSHFVRDVKNSVSYRKDVLYTPQVALALHAVKEDSDELPR